MEPDHPPIKREQARVIVKIDNRRRAARDRGRADAVPKFPRGRVSVRRAPRDRENVESLESQVIRQLLNALRPIDQSAVRLKCRITNSGPIRRNNSHVQLERCALGQLRHCPRARPAVEKENRHAGRAAIFAKREVPAITQWQKPAFVHRSQLFAESAREENLLSRKEFAL